MSSDPLEHPPRDTAVLPLFLQHFGLDVTAGFARNASLRDFPAKCGEVSAKDSKKAPVQILTDVCRAFSAIPYENLTKIIKYHEEGSAERARRWPREVLREHLSLGAGGTCFSLTATLLHLVRALGFEAEPLLADRSYGPNTHCALRVILDGKPHLVDPGFLVVRPIPLEAKGETRVETAFNELVLAPDGDGRRLDLHTVQKGIRKYRLTFKTAPADKGEFLSAWDASFEWDMMQYPLLTRVARGHQIYLQERRLQTRDKKSVCRSEVGLDDLPKLVEERFGVSAAVAFKATQILERRGALGRPPVTP